MNQPVCAVLGVGPGNGAAIARRFAHEGYRIALLSRSTTFSEKLVAELENTRAYVCDAADPEAVKGVFTKIRKDLGEADVLVYNAGSGTWGNVEEVNAMDLESAWRVNVLGTFTAAREVIPAMKKRGSGSIVLIGATASRRGSARAAAFAQAKAAQRTLAESMARHLWPAGIHVALVVIDGVVDLPRTRARLRVLKWKHGRSAKSGDSKRPQVENFYQIWLIVLRGSSLSKFDQKSSVIR